MAFISFDCANIMTILLCLGNNFCASKPNGNYQNVNKCSTFYACSNHATHIMNCPSGLWFNPKNGVCDYPKNVVCVPGTY